MYKMIYLIHNWEENLVSIQLFREDIDTHEIFPDITINAMDKCQALLMVRNRANDIGLPLPGDDKEFYE